MFIPILIFLSLIPSIFWLVFYLRRDVHSESKKSILIVFIWGMAAVLPTVLIEAGAEAEIEKINLPSVLNLALLTFGGIAFWEELLKYLVVRGKVFFRSEFDEPSDAMIYMITSALGFAAIENLLVLWPRESFYLTESIMLSVFRLAGATSLHILCSGTLGFFLALSFFKIKHGLKFTLAGFAIAIGLHGLYDFFIMSMGQMPAEQAIFPILILTVSVLIISVISLLLEFKKLKKLKGLCQV